MSWSINVPVGVVLTLLVVAAACAPAPAAAPASGASTAPAAASAPNRGGTARVGLSQEPIMLNPMMASQTVTSIVSSNILEGLVLIAADGTYQPELAEEVPSLQNGGVSADGLTITWTLKKGVTWSDGTPFTSKDVLFTYRVFTTAENPLVFRTGYSEIESVTAQGDHTVVVKYKRLYAPYRNHLSPILPDHVFGGNPVIDKHEFNRAPVGTGPFRFKSWASGDNVSLERNPNYRDSAKPLLDALIFKFVPSREAAIQAYKVGEIDVLWNLAEANIAELEAIADSVIQPAPSPRVERLILNTSCPFGPQQGDPACPHPILGDVRVRQAIELGIDKKTLVDKLLFGKTTVATSVIPLGWYAPRLPPAEYNVARARQLLDDAGWQAGPDGIRAKGGTRARLEFGTTTGDRLREQTQQVIQEQLKDIGIEIEIKNAPSAVILGSWQDNAPRARGSFDILMWTTNVGGLDPQGHLFTYFHSSQIPNEQSRGGQNFHRVVDSEIDRALLQADSTLDETARRQAYQTVAERVNAAKGHIVLYDRLQIDAYKRHVKGWTVNVHDNNVAWDSEHWWLER